MLARHIIESELTPFYPKLGTTVWSPLAGGVLSGKYGTDQSTWQDSWRGATLEQAQIAEDLRPIAEGLGTLTHSRQHSSCAHASDVPRHSRAGPAYTYTHAEAHS